MIMLAVTVVVIVGAFTATLIGGNRPELGLDLQGGLSVVLVPVKGSDASTLDAAVEIIRNRVDGLGIAEPDVSRQGNRIAVDLPGVKDRQRALDTVGATAELRFREVVSHAAVQRQRRRRDLHDDDQPGLGRGRQHDDREAGRLDDHGCARNQHDEEGDRATRDRCQADRGGAARAERHDDDPARRCRAPP